MPISAPFILTVENVVDSSVELLLVRSSVESAAVIRLFVDFHLGMFKLLNLQLGFISFLNFRLRFV